MSKGEQTAMPTLYLLNESSDAVTPGDLTMYRSLERMLSYVEAIDVRNGEFFAFVSDGRRISLSADSDYAQAEAHIEKVPDHADEVVVLLKDFLLWCANDGRFGVDVRSVEDAQDLLSLVNLIPEKLIS